MRRRLAVFVAAALALVLAVVGGACGSDDSAKKSTAATGTAKKGGTVKLWIMPNGPHPQEDMEKAVAPFTAKTGIKVNVEVVGWDVQFDRIRNAAVSGEGPDVTQAGTTQVPFFAALGGFEDLQDKVSQIGGASAYAPGIWKTSQVEGQQGTWGVPWFTEARTIYYRKDALKAAGVDPETAFSSQAALKATL